MIISILIEFKMYRFQPLSDLHIEFYRNYSEARIEDTDSDFIVLAGDIHTGIKGIKWLLEQKINKPIFYVCGNHEFYGTSYPSNIQKLKEAAKDTNIHVLENDYYIYKDLVILGCTLWTDYRLLDPIIPQGLAMHECYKVMNDFNTIRNSSYGYRKMHSVDVLNAHKESVDFLSSYLEVFKDWNVGVITHHPPSIRCINPKHHKDIISCAYASNLDELVAYSKAKFWVTGHTHYSCRFMLGDTLVVSNPAGYNVSPNTNFIKDLVIEV